MREQPNEGTDKKYEISIFDLDNKIWRIFFRRHQNLIRSRVLYHEFCPRGIGRGYPDTPI